MFIYILDANPLFGLRDCRALLPLYHPLLTLSVVPCTQQKFLVLLWLNLSIPFWMLLNGSISPQVHSYIFLLAS